MAKKLELIGNYLVITDTVDASTIEFASNNVSYKDSVSQITFQNSSDNSQDVSFAKSELRDSAGLEFSSDAELLTFLRSNTGFSLASASDALRNSVAGYYNLSSSFYFAGGEATNMTIEQTGVDIWTDVNMTIASGGVFDYRPAKMVDTGTAGHTGTGTALDPIIFKIEGLTIESFASFRASMTFKPDDDGGQLETRLLFSRHSGTTPSSDFGIEEVTLSMAQGADVDYSAEPLLSFFVGDSIDTNGAGDAGEFKFQVRSNVAGILSTRAMTLYLNQ